MSIPELLDLLIRWFHVIAGIMWIGNSLLFNWLDRNLVKPPGSDDRPGFQGKIWMVHSGAFYEVEKKLLEPHQLPDQLHWFKWQNGLTWLSGMFLLTVVYYLNGGAFLVDPRVSAIAPGTARWLGLGFVVGSWLVYDGLWRTLGKRGLVPVLLSLGLLVAVTFGLCHLLSGRAAFVHVGVVLGTVMTGNVWTVILPSQRSLIAATKAGREQDVALSLKAKQRSIHNNYMTFPLIFIMVSNHFPSTWADSRNWIVLLVLMAGGALVRHFMNVRYGGGTFPSPLVGQSPASLPPPRAARAMKHRQWILPTAIVSAATVIALVVFTARSAAVTSAGEHVAFAQVQGIVTTRCVACHSSKNTDPLFFVAQGGILMETPEQIRAVAPRIKERAVVLKTMPFLNRTNITDEERSTLGRWVDQGAGLE